MLEPASAIGLQRAQQRGRDAQGLERGSERDALPAGWLGERRARSGDSAGREMHGARIPSDGRGKRWC